MTSLLQGSYRTDFTSSFPGDTSSDPAPRQTPGILWSAAQPTPVSAPQLIGWSEDLAADLGIQKPGSQAEVDLLGGNGLAAGMYPYGACYGGHQFGHWAGQLGDGRAITLGEWEIPDGARANTPPDVLRHNTWELQLKGAGITPYSRNADGRAVLRSSVREYLMSEAMHHLGVPTTRALSLVSTGDPVIRDMFYDGHAAPEPGAVVCRSAPTFLRFGSFEILFARKEHAQLRQLAAWVMDRCYPHIQGAFEDRLVAWVQEVIARTARMIAEWMRVGFVHGVMNTDNMSVLGLTIDYGPYSMLDGYDAAFTPNTTDLPGRRYAFGRQAGIGKWNCACLAGALAPLLPDAAPLAAAVQAYDDVFGAAYYAMMGRKIGFGTVHDREAALIDQLSEVLQALKPDYTLFFLRLAAVEPGGNATGSTQFGDVFYEVPSEAGLQQLDAFLRSYQTLLREAGPEGRRQALMAKTNPQFVLRNYKLHEAIQALEKGDATLFNTLQEAIRHPYSDQYAALSGKRPDWAASAAGCSMLSCSS